MQIQLEEAGPCRRRLRIELEAEKVRSEYESTLKNYAQYARIPGFRPGRAPRNLVESRFKKDILQEVQDRLIPNSYREAIKQENLRPVAVLGVEDVRFNVGSPMSFLVTLDVPPVFQLPEYKGLKIKQTELAINEEEIEGTLTRIRESYARYEDVTARPVQKDDLVQIDFDAFIGGTPLETVAPSAKGLGSGRDFWVHAGENAFLPEFAEGLLGAVPGDQKTLQVTFSPDFREKSLVGQSAEFRVSVKAIRCKILPAMDKDFLEKIGVASEEVLRADVRRDLERLAGDREKARQKSELVKDLLNRTRMELPGSVVEEETRNTIYSMVRENTRLGVDRNMIEENRDKIFESAGKTAEEKVKARYLLHRIAEEEKILATPEDIDHRIQSMAMQYGSSEDAVRAHLAKNNLHESVAEQVRIDKTLQFLLDQAVVEK